MDEFIVCDGPASIEAYRLLALRAGLKLETKGLKRRGVQCSQIIKREFNLTGSKAKVLEQFEELLRKRGILS